MNDSVAGTVMMGGAETVGVGRYGAAGKGLATHVAMLNPAQWNRYGTSNNRLIASKA